MVHEAVQINGEGCVRETFDDIAGFQNFRAASVGRESNRAGEPLELSADQISQIA
jgi:hypothetical protein